MDATLQPSAIRPLERCGLHSWPAWFSPEETWADRDLGLRLHQIGGTLVAVASEVDAPLFNRVIGIGQMVPADPSLIPRLIQVYQEAGVPAFYVQVTPTAEPEDIGDWLRGHGFRPASPWARLVRGLEPVDDPRARVARRHVEIVETGSSRLPYSVFGQVVQRSFCYPVTTVPWFELFIGRRGWRHYLAIDRKKGHVVGAAAWFRVGRLASLEIAAVVPEARGRGIHSALVARQLRDAAEEGCARATLETSVDDSDWRGQAYRNARRLGFELAYFTANWEWRESWDEPRHFTLKRAASLPANWRTDVDDYRWFWKRLGGV
jgi:GNAT superfamily N-acetyltransferase